MAVRVARLLVAVSAVTLVSMAGAGWGQQQAPAGQAPTGQAPAGQAPSGQPAVRQPGQDGGPRRGPGGGQRQENAEGAMKAVNRAMRNLKEQISDPAKKDDNLRLIGEMERGLVTAKNMPLSERVVKDDDAAARAKKAGDYRRDLIQAIRTLLDMEEDVAAGKVDQAKAKLDTLQKLRDEAHDEMGVKKDD
jgi:hypothetical protein